MKSSKDYFWYFLETVYKPSFEGQTYRNPVTQERASFEWGDLHEEWAWLAQSNPRLCLQAPRGHLKTTVLGQGYPFWKMIQTENNQIVDGIYFSYKADLANEKVAMLKKMIKSNPICRFWRDLKPTSEYIIDFLVDWGEGPIGEVTLKGAGIKSATRGRHPSYVICDDILSDFSEPLTSKELQLINRIFRQVIMSLPSNEDDPLILVGTPQSYEDTLFLLATDPSWLWMIYPAVADWAQERVQWPEKYPFDRLIRIRNSITPSAFEVEYMLTPVTVTDQFLTRDDLNPLVDLQLRSWDLEVEFDGGQLAVYGGFDVGKRVHPSHVIVALELPDRTLVTLYQTFLDHVSYPEQVRWLNTLAERFNLTKGLFDATFNVLEDRGLSRRWIGRVFTRKLKGDLATGLERRVFARENEPGIVLLADERYLRQISALRKNLVADESADGHADSFWSTALMVKAADEGPSIVDMGGVDELRTRGRPDSARRTRWTQQLGVTSGVQ